jgi:hypothetical protein
MAGEVWRNPGARPLPFTAVQELAVNEVAFCWRERFPIVPLVWLDVVDRYADGEGTLEARALGRVCVMRQNGSQRGLARRDRRRSSASTRPATSSPPGATRDPAPKARPRCRHRVRGASAISPSTTAFAFQHAARARWELSDGPFTYWRGTTTSVELVGATRRSMKADDRLRA